MTVAERLAEIRESNGYSRKRLAAELQKPYGTITKYETGEREPGHDYIVTIAKKFGVSTDYILGISTNEKPSHNVERTKLGNGYEQLTPEHQKTVNDIISALLAKQREDETPVENVRFIDLFDLPVSAGSGVYLEGYDRHPIEIVNTPEAARADYALRISGDSMEPKFSDGDIVLVETMMQLPQKAVGVFIHEGEGFIKQLDGAYLRSLNPAYAPILANNETLIKGRVLGKAELV